ncbi:MAG: hypothetical protein ACRDVD_03010 [Acidimicrobiia bacterium]
MKFSQHIVVYATDEAALVDLVSKDTVSPPEGLVGLRLLRFRDKPGRYVIQADFDSWESADKSNGSADTQEWAERLSALIDGDPKYENLDVLLEETP